MPGVDLPEGLSVPSLPGWRGWAQPQRQTTPVEPSKRSDDWNSKPNVWRTGSPEGVDNDVGVEVGVEGFEPSLEAF